MYHTQPFDFLIAGRSLCSFQNAAGKSGPEFDLNNSDPFARVVLRQIYEVCLDTMRALISYVYPCFSVVNKLDCFSDCYSQIAVSSFYLPTTKIYIGFENVVRFDIPFTLLQIKSCSLGRALIFCYSG